jgi:hypothetical protein
MSIPRRFATGVWTYDGAIIERLDGRPSWTLWHPEQPIDPRRWIDGCDVHGVVIQDGFATVDDAAARHDKLCQDRELFLLPCERDLVSALRCRDMPALGLAVDRLRHNYRRTYRDIFRLAHRITCIELPEWDALMEELDNERT